MTVSSPVSDDPRHRQPQPPYPQKQQSAPGTDEAMQPDADHGESSYRGSGKLAGKRALITGADSGIGRAVALAFAREGADVAISYLNEDQDAQITARWVREAGRRAELFPGDIQSEDHCQFLVDETVARLGGLDILVNNAAFQSSHQSIDDITTDEFDRAFRTNVYAMFWLCKFGLKVMQPGGSIINTTSIQGYRPSSHLLHYAATKGAIVNFTKGLSAMAIERGVRVNAVAPGPIWTPLIPSTLPQERVQNFGKDTTLKRAGQPAELAPAFVYFASNADSSYVTGEILGVTGGGFIS